MPTPINGIGDSFEFASTASPTTYTTLAGVTSVSFSGSKLNTEKTLTMAGNGAETYQSTTFEPGSIDIKGFFYPGDTSQAAFQALNVPNAPAVSMKVLYGTSNSTTVTGVVESFVPSFPLDKYATFDAKIKLSGTITYA